MHRFRHHNPNPARTFRIAGRRARDADLSAWNADMTRMTVWRREWEARHPDILDLVADLSAWALPDDAMLKGARERWMTPSIMRTRITMAVRIHVADVRASVDRPQDGSIWTWQDALRRATPNAPAFNPTAGAAALGGVLTASGIDVAGRTDRVPEADVAAVARSARAWQTARADRRLTFRADTDQP
jgi:hypothetical protein